MSAEIRPLSAEFWPAFEELFGANGACGGCWCMVWRVPSKEWDARKGSRNRQSMRRMLATFEKAGFRDVHRWLPNRPIMRIDCG